MKRGIAFNQLEIYHDPWGRPMLRLFSNAALLAKKLMLTKMHVTVSDTSQYVSAMVIFEY